MDTIYREQAIDAVDIGNLHRGIVEALQNIISELPSAEKTGHWENIDIIHDRADAKITDWQQAQCSVCRKWQTKPYLYCINLDPYCPSCGARMQK